VVIYYFTANIIGRGSGRSAVGASAYRAGGVLRSAAYRSGEELRDDTGEIIHDYTRKGGVLYSEILLPDNAPPEYADRETLWNAVDAREIRKDAQLAREIVIALQREFDTQEQLEVLREYIQENFVDKGMIADFSIHDKGDGNPHVHIMLTMRHVTPDGFGNKNRDWNKKDYLEAWRESWADVNNRKFEEKGFDERIDHRSYKDRGIDREPMLHLGVEASRLEKQGIRTRRGDINREIQKRNEERALEKAQQEQETTEITANITNEAVAVNENPAVDELMLEKTAEHLNKLRNYYTTLEKGLSELIPERNEIRQEIPRLTFRAENIEEHTQNIEVLQGKITELQEVRQNLNFLQWKKKQEVNEALEQAQQDARQEKIFFKNRFCIDPSQAPEEVKRIQEKVRKKEADLMTKNTAILDIMDTQDKVLLGYHTQKLLAETRHDKDRLDELLQQMNKTPETVRDRLLQERIDRRLNIIPEESFQKVIEKLPQEHAQTLINTRKRAKEVEQEHERARERTRTIERSR